MKKVLLALLIASCGDDVGVGGPVGTSGDASTSAAAAEVADDVDEVRVDVDCQCPEVDCGDVNVEPASCPEAEEEEEVACAASNYACILSHHGKHKWAQCIGCFCGDKLEEPARCWP